FWLQILRRKASCGFSVNYRGIEFTYVPASKATPQQTRMVAAQRRRSTFSCRKILAASALVTKVREAAAGTTRLTSAHESANSSVKNATNINATATQISRLLAMRRITLQAPALRQSSMGLPICFMARDMRQSPAVEANTIEQVDDQVERG